MYLGKWWIMFSKLAIFVIRSLCYSEFLSSTRVLPNGLLGYASALSGFPRVILANTPPNYIHNTTHHVLCWWYFLGLLDLNA